MAEVRLSLFLLPFLFACAQARVVPFTQANITRYPAKAPSAVGVYRSVIPFQTFEEMGLITVTLPSKDLGRIYEELRAGAAELGADAVVGVKVDMRFHAEPLRKEVCRPQQTCVPQASCSTQDDVCKTENVCTSTPVCSEVTEPANTTSYLGIGTMIRRTP